MNCHSERAKTHWRFMGTIKVMAVLVILGFSTSAGAGSASSGNTPPASGTKQMLEQFWLNAYEADTLSSTISGTSTMPSTPETPVTPKGEQISLSPQRIQPSPIPGQPSAQSSGDEFFASLSRELLAKAQPDECFNGIGKPYTCPGKKLKVNQAYVWGLAKSGKNVWLGTAPNVQCLAIGAYGPSAMDPTIPLDPIQTDSWVCEFGSSQYSKYYPKQFPPAVGDWRAPHIYAYDTVQKILTEKTPKDPEDPAFLAMTGIRAAGSIGNLVFMAGPGTPGPSKTGSITISAFLSDSGTYLGSQSLFTYNNIRKWVTINNVLYTAVRNVNVSINKGSVLRWTGDLVKDPSTGLFDLNRLFQFTVVGNLKDGEGAELAEHEGRLFVTTWPGNMLVGEEITNAALYMSPHIPEGGLISADAGDWTNVWQADDYEPDWVTAATYGGGALASFDGYLYWGTMHVPLTSALAHFKYYGMPDNEEDILATVLATYRPISIFRGRNFDTTPQLQVVYGMPYLPKYVEAGTDPQTEPGHWEIVPNKMGPPILGLSGFGNFFNNYTWTMSVYQNQLFIGTMDWSYFVGEQMTEFLDLTIGAIPKDLFLLPTHFYGADLFRIKSSHTPAVPESLAGVGNYTSYGIRTMLSDDALYLGMANPMNLLTDPDDDLPEGGWELIKLMGDIHVSVDINPGSCPNRIPLKSQVPLTVAVLGTPDFDVRQIEFSTVMLCRDTIGGKIAPIRSRLIDVATPFEGELCGCNDLNGDGYTDLVFVFNTREVVKKLLLREDKVPLTLTGGLKKKNGGGATRFVGQDCVSIVKGW